MIEHLVVISLVENQNSVVPQRGVELGKSLATILLGVQMRERVAEADYRVVFPTYGAVQLPPIGLDGLEDEPMFPTVFERFGEHGCRAVDTGDIKVGIRQADGMEAGARGDVKNAVLAVCP